MLPKPTAGFQQPAWWSRLDGSRPVVLVTQGTIANEDPSQLIEPTLTSLAGEEVIIVDANGGLT
jgi:UDP:flavonoid glycosyltransferase YjiC (YdhE family)